jgi:GrpB-like predicted nucleotidyltransferase (UPF0157 family)
MPADIDEPIEIVSYDERWPDWYADDAAEVRRVIGGRLLAIEHFGSTAVIGLVAKPIIDVLVALVEWPLTEDDRHALESLGYEYVGEAGVSGREYLRRRSPHATNLAVVKRDGAVWRDNLAFRDYLRSHAEAAVMYAHAKQRAWADGARALLQYSEFKHTHVAAVLADAKKWQAG